MRQPLPSPAAYLLIGPPWRFLAFALGLVAAAPNLASAGANVSAGQAEAKEVAKSQGNCTPAKVDVMRYAPGREGNTVFKVGCSEDKDAFVLVQCRSRICALLR